MRRVSEAFRSAAGMFSTAFGNIGAAMTVVAEKMQREQDARLARESTAIGMMMRDHPTLSAADAQRIYRLGATQLMTPYLTAGDLTFLNPRILPGDPVAVVSPVRAGKTAAAERAVAEARALDPWRDIYQVQIGSRSRPKLPFDPGNEVDENDPATAKAIDLIQRRRRESYDAAVLRAIAPPRNPR
jgi:hypothetical protein